MVDVVKDLFLKWINSPDRDLVTTVLTFSAVVAYCLVKNITWGPGNLGKWTRRARAKFNFNDPTVKLLCSVAPFLVDCILSPLHVLQGLRRRPSLNDDLEEIKEGLVDCVHTFRKHRNKTRELLQDLRENLARTGTYQAQMMDQVENRVRGLAKDTAELEEAYATSRDKTLEDAVLQKLSVEAVSEEERTLYDKMLGENWGKDAPCSEGGAIGARDARRSEDRGSPCCC